MTEEYDKPYLFALTSVLSRLQAAGVLVGIDVKLNEARLGWYEALKPEVPLAELKEVIWATLREKCEPDKPPTKILSAMDVLRFWRSQQAEAAEQARQEELAHQPCQACNDTKQIEVGDPKTMTTVTLPCPYH
jgi:hypothetical protein